MNTRSSSKNRPQKSTEDNTNEGDNYSHPVERRPIEKSNDNIIVLIIKLLFIFIFLLPWLFSISRRVRDYDFYSKVKTFMEDIFTCPTCSECKCPEC